MDYYTYQLYNFLYFRKLKYFFIFVIYLHSIVLSYDLNMAHFTNSECCICMDIINYSTNNCVTPCGHSFCFQCLAKALERSNTCPCCRTELMQVPEHDDDDDEYTLYSSDDDEDDDDYEDDERDPLEISDYALTSFRWFFNRIHDETIDQPTDQEPTDQEPNDEEPTDDEEDEPNEQLASVELITHKLQAIGITMVDLVALITERKSTIIHKHTDKFFHALEKKIIYNIVEKCDLSL